MVSGGDDPPSVLGQTGAETLPPSPEDQLRPPHRSECWTAAPAGRQGSTAAAQTHREETL